MNSAELKYSWEPRVSTEVRNGRVEVCVCAHIYLVFTRQVFLRVKMFIANTNPKNFRSDSNIVLKRLVDSRKRTSFGRLSKYGVRMASPAQSNPDYI